MIPPPRLHDYETDGTAIYRRSFAMIRAESDLTGFTSDEEVVAVRMIHAAGDTTVARDIAFAPGFVAAARTALDAGAPILTDATMIATGITRARLGAANPVHCLLRDERATTLAHAWGTTRSAAAVSLWGELLAGAVVAIGNAPTALFHLLDLVAAGGPRPAAVVGVPVGFIGAAESKQALVGSDLPWLTVRGRRGGSAMAVAAVNALAQRRELP